MKMQFGKHRGEDVEDIPTDYLEWVEENLDLDDQLRDGINHELKKRRGGYSSKGVVTKKPGERQMKIED